MSIMRGSVYSSDFESVLLDISCGHSLPTELLGFQVQHFVAANFIVTRVTYFTAMQIESGHL